VPPINNGEENKISIKMELVSNVVHNIAKLWDSSDVTVIISYLKKTEVKFAKGIKYRAIQTVLLWDVTLCRLVSRH
jgi:hypothetical protein